jgi:hypothetical protein
MSRLSAILTLVVSVIVIVAQAQSPPPVGASNLRPWEILDNSFLVEEAFNQETRIFQNIFTWTRGRDRTWNASFTQEWPAPGMTHQLSYTLPFSGTGYASGIGDVLLNYRYQLRAEDANGPAISPRFSLILPAGREADGLGGGTTGFQINVPVSKQFGNLYVHANAGYTRQGDVPRVVNLAGSAIWRVVPTFNVMLEAVVEVDESVTLSPGVRHAWNIGTHQLVVGTAVPITRAEGRSSAAFFTYLSYELPFRK